MRAERAKTHVHDPGLCLREKQSSRDPCPWLFNDACAKRTFTRPWPLALKSTRVVNAFGSSAAQKERSQDPGPWPLVLSPRSHGHVYKSICTLSLTRLTIFQGRLTGLKLAVHRPSRCGRILSRHSHTVHLSVCAPVSHLQILSHRILCFALRRMPQSECRAFLLPMTDDCSSQAATDSKTPAICLLQIQLHAGFVVLGVGPMCRRSAGP